jgi:hypothetical protein
VVCAVFLTALTAKAQQTAGTRLAPGKTHIEVIIDFPVLRPGAPADITIKVNGRVVAEGTVPITAPLDSRQMIVSTLALTPAPPSHLITFDEAPFAFNGTIEKTQIKYVQPK